MLIALLLVATLFLAYFNGANDNFKGVATLYGSGTLTYKKAIIIATIATFVGSICAIFLAQGLVKSFSGKGLVPTEIAGSLDFLVAVGFGAGTTVLLATRLGFPISTTHSLVGALVGAGLMAIGLDVNFAQMSSSFVIPLLVSPFIAFALGALVYWVLTTLRKKFGLSKESCVCIGEAKQFKPISALTADESSALLAPHQLVHNEGDVINPHITIAETSECVDMYTDKAWGFNIQRMLDRMHILSGAAVSFARGLNDTPKIAGLLVAAKTLDIRYGMIAIATGMAIGGLLNSRRVAETMSLKITEINHGQGFSANLVTSFLVIVASKFGVPVSTTHVSVGSIFGIGMVSKKQNANIVMSIILSWVITLPIAMLFSAVVYYLLAL